MVNYDELPLFPLHVVLYPDMPLPLHIFEPRYRDMVAHCRTSRTPFGIVLIQATDGNEQDGKLHAVGTVARITQCVELPDGRLNIVVVGETRFQINETHRSHTFLTASTTPINEKRSNPADLRAPHLTVVTLFKRYLRNLSAVINRPLSAVQLPQDAESLSYAVASVLQIPAIEKQSLLQMTYTHERLEREVELLKQEIENHTILDDQSDLTVRLNSTDIVPFNPYAMSELFSRN